MLRRESLVRGAKMDGMEPFVAEFDARGTMTIGWPYMLAEQKNIKAIATSSFMAKGEPRKL